MKNSNRMTRRDFVARSAMAATLMIGFTAGLPAAIGTETPTASRLPRWRGFNLLEKFVKRREGNPPFLDSDFAMMEEWGFDFARLPMSC
jgi:endoglucanase